MDLNTCGEEYEGRFTGFQIMAVGTGISNMLLV